MKSATAPSPRQSDARWRLREATQATHERMHLLPPFRAIEARALDRAGYARLLTALLAYHSAIAETADREGLGRLSSSARRREHLERDLDFLASDPAPLHPHPRAGGEPSPDVAPGETDRGWIPAFAGMTKGVESATVLGALYVAEGSMLGGRMIARQLDYLFADAPEGRGFFIGTREDDAHWRRLLAAIEEANDDEKTLQTMIAGAEASFAHFGRCIGMCG